VRTSHPGNWRTFLACIPLLLAGATLAPLPAAAQPAADPEAQLITLDAESTRVVTILEILAERSGLNIVTAPGVEGRSISLHLRDTPFLEALNLVVRAAGLGYERVGNSILVADPTHLRQQTGLATQVYHLEYADAAEVTEALQMVSQDIRSFVSGNRVVVRAPQSVLDEIRDVVEILDQPPPQVMFEARLVEVQTSNLEELGIDWERITKWTSIITEGDPGESGLKELPDDMPFLKLDEFDDYFRQQNAIELVIDFLITEGRAKVLANSKITTVTNQPAKIFIGQVVPVVVTSLQSGQSGGTFQTVQLQEIEVGISLELTPRVSDDGHVTSLVSPSVSNIVGFVGPDSDLPQTAERSATSLIRVKDGETFYLGGLLSEESRQTVKKVPILGDIPLLKYLFRHYRNEIVTTDLVIEVTPTIIRTEG